MGNKAKGLYKQFREMVEHQRTKYNWQFVFLGANQVVASLAIVQE